ncbi:unnamed protein product [Polarella glacialis]|uniref:BTB domain-containing protein n=1 Tax=Polarella glacialis TaxID=89957 RepID=A0A813K750_POLGL|nr:unnamed protein product [Polarella glacialis]
METNQLAAHLETLDAVGDELRASLRSVGKHFALLASSGSATTAQISDGDAAMQPASDVQRRLAEVAKAEEAGIEAFRQHAAAVASASQLGSGIKRPVGNGCSRPPRAWRRRVSRPAEAEAEVFKESVAEQVTAWASHRVSLDLPGDLCLETSFQTLRRSPWFVRQLQVRGDSSKCVFPSGTSHSSVKLQRDSTCFLAILAYLRSLPIQSEARDEASLGEPGVVRGHSLDMVLGKFPAGSAHRAQLLEEATFFELAELAGAIADPPVGSRVRLALPWEELLHAFKEDADAKEKLAALDQEQDLGQTGEPNPCVYHLQSSILPKAPPVLFHLQCTSWHPPGRCLSRPCCGPHALAVVENATVIGYNHHGGLRAEPQWEVQCFGGRKLRVASCSFR